MKAIYSGPPLFGIPEEPADASRDRVLQTQIKRTKAKLAWRASSNRRWFVSGCLIVVLAPVYAYIEPWISGAYPGTAIEFAQPVVLVSLLYASAFLVRPLIFPLRDIERELQDYENELDLLTIKASEAEKRAEKLFKVHQIELKRYYDQTLGHSGAIFVVGVLCILVGFGILGWAIWFLTKPEARPNSTTGLTRTDLTQSTQIVTASLAAIGGFCSNYVAFIYLKMYSETIRSLGEFHNRLVFTNHLHFANFLLSKVNEKERDTAICDVARAMAKAEMADAAPPPPPA